MSYFVIGLFGLCFGSFASVLTFRIPKRISILTPRSRCEKCGQQIPALQLVPVFSFLIGRGKTSCCKTKLSSIYPGIEVGTCLLFLISFRISNSYPEFLALIILSVLTIPLMLIDIAEHRLPNQLTFFGLASGLVLATSTSILNGDFGVIRQTFLFSFFSSLFFFILNVITRGGMGMGDVKLAAMLSALCAPIGGATIFAGFAFAFLIGLIIGIALLISKRASRKSVIPFGPSMLFGTWLALSLGDSTSQSILSLWIIN